jgi:hypothetical protein
MHIMYYDQNQPIILSYLPSPLFKAIYIEFQYSAFIHAYESTSIIFPLLLLCPLFSPFPDFLVPTPQTVSILYSCHTFYLFLGLTSAYDREHVCVFLSLPYFT